MSDMPSAPIGPAHSAGDLQLLARLMQFPRVVILARGVEIEMIEEFAQHVRRDAGISVPLSIPGAFGSPVNAVAIR